MLILRTDDPPQDPEFVAEFTGTTSCNHLLAEYEIVKDDGDLEPPKACVALDEPGMTRNIESILASFGPQLEHTWFDHEASRGPAGSRGVEPGVGLGARRRATRARS